ncbi:MAG: 1-deoxy-D-xylulose-5-phosphate reductoisomerase [Firmicutes bacterium]|nr:1-deoxy-D-xylulose-5-phosphate reductoisomerase [Bacillota bacterium]
MKKIGILGSTGSIGTQALEVIRNNRDQYQVTALSCAKNIDLLRRQIEEFSPKLVAVESWKDARSLSCEYGGIEFYYGPDGLNQLAAMEESDIVLNSLMGMRGLEPTMTAIEAGKDIAFANKETLVVGGEIVTEAVKRKGVKLLPVDSEHSAIFQCIQGSADNPVRRIILTASGGPFRGYTREQLEQVTLEQALNHPNWSMGNKITIDSATMMNKGLEIIEAKWLFDVPIEDIQVVVHPESVLHSAVEFMDRSVIGQMGNPDMRIPIAYAFSYPERTDLEGLAESLDFFSLAGGLNFYEADRKVFKTIELACEASRRGGSYPVIMNGANEVLVDKFLKGQIKFTDIQDHLERVLEEHVPVYGLSLEQILEEDAKIRKRIEETI